MRIVYTFRRYCIRSRIVLGIILSIYNVHAMDWKKRSSNFGRGSGQELKEYSEIQEIDNQYQDRERKFISEATIQLFNAVHERNEIFVYNALQSGANPNSVFRSTRCDKATWWLLDADSTRTIIAKDGVAAVTFFGSSMLSLFVHSEPASIFTLISAVGSCYYSVKYMYDKYAQPGECCGYQRARRKKNVDKDGKTPLILATVDNQADIVKMLLDNNAQVDRIDSKRNSALFYAVQQNNQRIVRLLCLAGATIDENRLSKMVLYPELRETVSKAYATRNFIVSQIEPAFYLLQEGTVLEQVLPEKNLVKLVLDYSLPIIEEYNEAADSSWFLRQHIARYEDAAKKRGCMALADHLVTIYKEEK